MYYRIFLVSWGLTCQVYIYTLTPCSGIPVWIRSTYLLLSSLSDSEYKILWWGPGQFAVEFCVEWEVTLLFFCIQLFNLTSTICWRHCLFFSVYFLSICENLGDCRNISLYLRTQFQSFNQHVYFDAHIVLYCIYCCHFTLIPLNQELVVSTSLIYASISLKIYGESWSYLGIKQNFSIVSTSQLKLNQIPLRYFINSFQEHSKANNINWYKVLWTSTIQVFLPVIAINTWS